MSMQYDDSVQDLIDAPDFKFGSRSGRAVSDDRGNMIWEWQTEPGIYSREVTAQQLHKLSANELQLLDVPQFDEPVQWSRKRVNQPHRVKPVHAVNIDRSSAFDFFLKKLGLPA